MADVDDELRSEGPVAPSFGFAAAVMEAVRLERRAPPANRPPRLALVACGLAILVAAAALAVAVLGDAGHSAGDARLVAAIDRVHPYVEWAARSGCRMLVATLGLVAVILVVRHAERWGLTQPPRRRIPVMGPVTSGYRGRPWGAERGSPVKSFTTRPRVTAHDALACSGAIAASHSAERPCGSA